MMRKSDRGRREGEKEGSSSSGRGQPSVSAALDLEEKRFGGKGVLSRRKKKKGAPSPTTKRGDSWSPKALSEEKFAVDSLQGAWASWGGGGRKGKGEGRAVHGAGEEKTSLSGSGREGGE